MMPILKSGPGFYKKPFYISIGIKFYLLMVLLIGLPMVSSMFYVVSHEKKIMRNEMESRARSMVVSLALQGNQMILENLYLIQQSLTDYSRLPDVSQILFIDFDNMVMAANDPLRIGEILSGDSLYQTARKSGKETIAYYRNKEGIETLAIFEPMFLNNKVHGWIRLDLSLKQVEIHIRKNTHQLVLLTSLFALIAIISVFAISRKISAVLSLLVNKFKKLEDRDFTEKLFVRSHDELKELADSYNHLVDEKQLAFRQLHQMAYYDSLTGLPNRLQFYDLIGENIQANSPRNEAIAIVVMDLDRFKEVNDTLGHAYGDSLLLLVSAGLKKVLRPTDTIARLGGDEFGIILPMASAQHIDVVLQKLLKVLRGSFEIKEIPLVIEAGMGIALYPRDGEEPDTLFRRADIAMYESKRHKLSHTFYHPEIDQYSPEKFALLGELSHGIENGELFLLFQPIVNLNTGLVSGVEALVRWRHPVRGLIPPDQFVFPAEQTGLIKPLTLYILQKALSQCHAWRREGKKVSMAVNISVRNLEDPYFCEQMVHLLQFFAIDPSLVYLEVVETSMMTHAEKVMDAMICLSNAGIHFSIDDFGTGYSSLSYLRKLPIKTVKIDKSFIREMTIHKNDALIVRSIIEMAHTLDLTVVAEGVENQETYQQLAALGCDEAQGYFIKRPVPVEEINF
ncbi:MAG: EAL domain-containing protein [Nitrospirae bacterium]|nr:EAL domain-containing protein [Nitrospirota bacterium]